MADAERTAEEWRAIAESQEFMAELASRRREATLREARNILWPGVDMALKALIRFEFKVRGLKWPTTQEAMMWIVTELGEAAEVILADIPGWVRNHPENHPPYSEERLAEEIGDVIYMMMVLAIINGVSPLTAMVKKITRKAEEVTHGGA